MSGKYCKVKTVNDYPVSVCQVRQLRRNVAWYRSCRGADVGTWGRFATDAGEEISGAGLNMRFTRVWVDATYCDTLYFGFVVDGSGTATWTVAASTTTGLQEFSVDLTNPGTAEAHVDTAAIGLGTATARPFTITVTRNSGTGTLRFRYVGLWAHRSAALDYGPQNLRSALAGDLMAALEEARRSMLTEQPLIGWFGSYDYPSSTGTALRWYQLGDKLDDDESLNSQMDARCRVYEIVAASGATFTTTHTQNTGAGASVTISAAGAGPYHDIDIFRENQSYDTSSPYSGGKLELAATAGSSRPQLKAFQLTRTASPGLCDAIRPDTMPKQDYQIRTDEATGAVGINDIATTIHKATWYQGGNCSGGMASGAGKDFTISTSYVTVFDGLIWVHNDAQSGSTWGSNTYQVAVRASNGGTSVDMTCRLTVDGQTGTATKTFAAGEQYLLFEPAITGIDVTDYAVACKVELLNSASRTTTVYSVHISRRGAAY